MHLGMMMAFEVKQTLTKKCPICEDKEFELWMWDATHNAHLGIDPEAALSHGLCPCCYQNPYRMDVDWSNKVGKWIQEELKKKVPAWREMALRPEEEPFRSIPARLYWYNRDLHDRFLRQGGCRGLLDYASAEFKNTSIPKKRELLKELKTWGIDPSLVRSACVRYLEVISKESYARAVAFIDEGWDIVMGGQ